MHLHPADVLEAQGLETEASKQIPRWKGPRAPLPELGKLLREGPGHARKAASVSPRRPPKLGGVPSHPRPERCTPTEPLANARPFPPGV